MYNRHQAQAMTADRRPPTAFKIVRIQLRYAGGLQRLSGASVCAIVVVCRNKTCFIPCRHSPPKRLNSLFLWTTGALSSLAQWTSWNLSGLGVADCLTVHPDVVLAGLGDRMVLHSSRRFQDSTVFSNTPSIAHRCSQYKEGGETLGPAVRR